MMVWRMTVLTQVAYYTKEINEGLPKPPLQFNGGLA